MRSAVRRDVLAGALAGLVGGLVFGSAIQAQAKMGTLAGLLGLPASGAGWLAQLLLAVVLGAGFGALIRYQAGSYAATLSSGLLLGLLWWIVGPLTVLPLLMGSRPTWSFSEAAAAFPDLVGFLLYGGATGLCYAALATLLRRMDRGDEHTARSVELPIRRVVILGGGFAGVSAAQRLEQLLIRDPSVEITLVSQSNFLLFTPMLAEVASSALEAQHISAPVRAALQRSRVRRATVVAIDTDAQTVRVHSVAAAPVETLPYDQLVLALGSEPNFYGLPGLEENSFTLKTLDDATRLRNHVLAMLERADSEPDATARARQLTFVVAGAGFAGTEMIAELFDLVHSVRRFYPRIESGASRFVLVHSGDRILPELSPELSEYALRKLTARGIESVLGARVAGARPDAVLLNDGSELATHTLVWTAGNQPHPLLKTLPCERSRAGAVITDSMLQVNGFTNVWAVGDCAQIPDAFAPHTSYPPTAQHALREGAVVAGNVVAALRGRPLKPFRFRSLGTLVVLGRRTAAAEIRGWKFSGLLAWLMWRAIYLSKLPGLEKKVRVALDWAIDVVFPRDIVLTMQAPGPLPSAAPGRDGAMPQADPARPEDGSPAAKHVA